MTRLFLRFYLGVIIILIAAWQIQGYVFRTRGEEENARVVERALSGGARLARQRILEVAPQDAAKEFAAIRSQFEIPMRVVDIEQRPTDEETMDRIQSGEVVLLYGSLIELAFPGNEKLLEFGPLEQFVGPSQTEVTLGYGSVFALAALAIAILLRPVASQLRAVERTATAIAGGDLSARIDDSQWRRSLPLANAFNDMANRTEMLLRSQRELLQAVSHELRTPLARIRFATDLIETAKSDEERQRRLKAVDNATQELDDLVSELLTYVRLESEASTSEHEPIELRELLAELSDIHSPLHGSVNFAFHRDSQDVQINADRASLSRAIGNLLNNAGRFANSRVEFGAYREGDTVTIVVDDDGSGIAEADRQRVFEPFTRLQNSSDHDSGTGLGLALVRRIVTGHHGNITASTSPSGGARFQINLPANDGSPESHSGEVDTIGAAKSDRRD